MSVHEVQYKKDRITLYDSLFVVHCVHALLKIKELDFKSCQDKQTQHSWSCTTDIINAYSTIQRKGRNIV